MCSGAYSDAGAHFADAALSVYTFASTSITSNADLQGAGVRAARHDLTGPMDDTYLFSDKVELRDVNYAPCAKASTPLVNTMLVLNNPRRQGGYINNSAINGETETKKTSKLVINLVQQACPAK